MTSPDLDRALLEAVRRRSPEHVRAALESGADPNVLEPQTTLTPLMLASGCGDLASVQTLIRAGALVNAMDTQAGATALHKACQGGHAGVVRWLVDEAEALIDLRVASTGHTPLVEAIWFKSDAIVEYLLERNARIELTTHYGFTLQQHIDYAKKVNGSPGAQRALQRIDDLVKARMNRDRQAQSDQALNRAVLEGDLGAVNAALASGSADLEQRWPIVGSFQDGHTPLLIATRDGHTEITRILVAAGANANATEPLFGAVPLHKATYNGYLEITKVLTRAPGIDLDYQGPSNGYTPLHDALWHAKPDCAIALLDAGARIDLVAYDGKLAIDIAREELGPEHPLIQRLQPPPETPGPRAAAGQRSIPYDPKRRSSRHRAREIVHSFFAHLEAMDIESFIALFTPDGRQFMPFSPEGFPRQLNGRAEIARQYKSLPAIFSSIRFHDVRIDELADPNRVFVTYRGDMALKEGSSYKNTYAGLFVTQDGQITEYYEYFDPNVLSKTFGSLLGKSFNAPPEQP